MFGLTLMGDAFALRVAATLLHFVWQGQVLALVAVLLNRLLSNASARARYSVNVCLLLAMVACLPLTFSIIDGSTVEIARSNVDAGTDFGNPATGGSPSAAESAEPLVMPEHLADVDEVTAAPSIAALSESKVLPYVRRESLAKSASGSLVNGDFFRAITSLAPFVTWAYFAGVLFMTARLVVGLRGGQSLRRNSLPVEDAGLLAMVRKQAASIGLSCVPAVAFCERISVPIVFGIMRPMILLPATLVSGLSSDQIRALVTHELSHIRRYDLLVNLLQRIVEAVLFFHPAVWFVSRRISMERENVADDAVLAAGWPPIRYADALVRMAELSSTLRTPGVTMQVAALAAVGSSSSEFKRRIIRLLDGSPSSQIRLSHSGIFAMALATASLLMTPVAFQLAAENVPLEVSDVSETEDAEERETISAPDNPQTSDAEGEDSDEIAGLPQIIDGFVTGPGGAIAGVKTTVTLSIVDEGVNDTIDLSIGTVVATLEYTTDENGRYKIVFPADLASNPLVRVRVDLTHPKFLGRQMGPLLASDFDGKRIGNDQPYWMGRQLARQAIKQSRLRKANPLTGRILLPDGTPAVGAKVKTATKYRAYSWKFHNADDYGASDKAVTDSDGRFSIMIDESASFTAMMPGQAPLLVDDLTKRIPIANGDAPTDFRLPVANRIKGRVVTDEGKPVPRAIVIATRDGKWNEFDMPLSFAISSASNELGYYELPPLPADKYRVSVRGQLTSESDPRAYSQHMSKVFSSYLPGSSTEFHTQPIELVFVQKSVTLEPFSPFSTVDLQASPMVTLKVNVEFPDGVPPENRQPDVGISGTINGKEWNGQYAKADDNGVAILRAPKGLEWAFIKTGLARHRRSANSEVEIGQAIHFKRLDEDMSDVTVIKPEFAKLKVKVTQVGDVASENAKSPGRITISASYARKGFREQSSDRQKIGLTGAMQSGQTEYRGTALPNEPIILTVGVREDGKQIILHEEQLTLAPGEDRLHEITILPGKPFTSKAKLEAAISRACGYLQARQRADGSWAGNNKEKGYTDGTTALVALALFEDGAASGTAIQNATQYLLNASPNMTKEIALQTIFLQRLGKSGAAIYRRNLKWLVDGQIKQGPDAGGWGYQRSAINGNTDGANSAYAVLALATVVTQNPADSDEIPTEVWQRTMDWLLKTQHEDGSWGYTARGSTATGSMTACGLAGLKALRSQLKATPQIDEAIENGESWLATNWNARRNSGGSSWPLFHLNWVCRALHNRPILGEREWYSEVVEKVLASQQPDGSFSLSPSTSPIISTAFALDILRSCPVQQLDR
jgi:beta-lactamase regulating signal transducer with metallopeptidase domain